MAPLTLTDKYRDLIRLSDESSNLLNKLSESDFHDVQNRRWPFLIRSVTSNSQREIRVELAKNFRLDFQLFSKISREFHRDFPERIPIEKSIKDKEKFILNENDELAERFIFCHSEKTSSLKNFFESIENSAERFQILQFAIKECCRCGTLKILEKLTSPIGFSLDKFRFANGNDFLHQTIRFDNEKLTNELLKRKFDVNSIGEFGTPLITALHFDVLWAVELLLKNGADLTSRHVDWPHWTIYQYCIQFDKIRAKIFIEQHLKYLIQQGKFSLIDRLNRSGWKIEWKRFCQRKNRLRIDSIPLDIRERHYRTKLYNQLDLEYNEERVQNPL